MSELLKGKMNVEGNVQKITYRNESNGYTVLILDADGESITAVGIMPFINEGDDVKLSGDIKVHSVYGEQLSVVSFEKIIKTDTASLFKYLSSGSIKGIGQATARNIVDRFGERSFDIIENYPERLAEIKGISLSKAMSIAEEYAKQQGMRELVMFLSQFSVSADLALKIYKKYGNSATELIRKNPYVLCDDEIGFSFEAVEEIANTFGIDNSFEARIEAGIMYVLKRNLWNGHTCLPEDKLLNVATALLGCDYELVAGTLTALKESFQLSYDKTDSIDYIYLPEYYKAENYIAGRLLAVKNFIPKITPLSPLEVELCEARLGIEFDDKQISAISAAVDNGLLILTGGPGTGKTTTLNAIIKIFAQRELSMVLAAPTGRAAKRMTELTGSEAKTIHRLLEVEWDKKGRPYFARNERNKLDCDVIIVDEMSMVDSLLFEGLLRALKSECRIVLVGDSDQLPSVGAGNVLNDLIESEIIPTVRLDRIFRQSGESNIITTAHAIINGNPVNFSNSSSSDSFMLTTETADETNSTIIDLVLERLPETYGFNPKTDIQILTPSRKLDCGCEYLNKILQNTLNPIKHDFEQMNYMGNSFRVGDKVMQTENNYDLVWYCKNGESGTGVFNGDIGFIEKIDKRNGFLKVKYDDKTVEYFADDIKQLELAYAVTVHKSQGSEFDCVIIPLLDTPKKLRYRNLLYTAVTRAKKMLLIIGKKSIFGEMVQNDKRTLRYTGLVRKLLELENELV